MPKLTMSSASNSSADARLKAPRLAIFAILGVALCWLVISHSVVASLSTTAPETALFLRANEPRSLLARADNEINSNGGEEAKTSKSPPPTPKRLQLLHEEVETALLLDPLSSRAYRLLGQIAEKEGSAAKAEKFMREATRHSLRQKFRCPLDDAEKFRTKELPRRSFLCGRAAALKKCHKLCGADFGADGGGSGRGARGQKAAFCEFNLEA